MPRSPPAVSWRLEMGAQPDKTWGVAPVETVAAGSPDGPRHSRPVCHRREPDVQGHPAGDSRRRGGEGVGDPLHAGRFHTEAGHRRDTDQPIPVSESVTLKAIAFQSQSRVGPALEVGRDSTSPVMSVTFRRLTDYPRITLSAKYAPQYTAAGDDTLIDGLRGNDSFKTGRWQGYLGTDLDITLDFGKARDVRHVAMGFLQDTGSSILMPRRIDVALSEDGATFTPVGTVAATVPESESTATIGDYALELPEPRRARYVRIRVERYGKLPGWHPGAGSEAWFFADEIIVR